MASVLYSLLTRDERATMVAPGGGGPNKRRREDAGGDGGGGGSGGGSGGGGGGGGTLNVWPRRLVIEGLPLVTSFTVGPMYNC
jgi:hypothetical protein